MLNACQPVVLWADRMTIRCTTGYSPFYLMGGQDVVLPIELENLTWNTTNWTQGIDDRGSHLSAGARQLEQRREVIDAAMNNLNRSRDTNKCYFNRVATLCAEDLRNVELVLAHET